MSNITADRHVEDDWWKHPIPENVVWGEGLYIETAMMFRFMRSKLQPAIELGEHVSCYAGVSFALGEKGSCKVGDFTLLNGALIMASERIEIGKHCLVSWNVGIADSDFHPIDAAQRRIDSMALAPFYKDRPPRPEIKTAPGHHSRQRLDRHECGHPERRHDWREFRGGGRSGGFQERAGECGRRGQSGGHREAPHMTRKRIIVMGFMANIPIAGVIWQHIHYIVGLQRLGHEVYYVEDSASLPYNPTNHDVNWDYAYALETLARLAAQFGFEERWAFCPRYLPGDICIGLTRAKLLELYRTADAILNICGAQELNEDVLQSQRIIYVESDPGVEQIRVDKGESKPLDYLSKHRALFTFGENIGNGSPIPDPSISMAADAAAGGHGFLEDGRRAAARSSLHLGGQLEYRRPEGHRVARGKVSLEQIAGIFEIHRSAGASRRGTSSWPRTSRTTATRERFLQNGWRLSDPQEMSIHHDLYRRYLQESKGEFTVAKDQYVRLNTGWFSDRTACYLASGRPAITQETGFTRHYGGGKGLFAFTTLEDIAEAVRAINADYAAHCRAAYEIAAEYFEATKVLASLLDRIGI